MISFAKQKLKKNCKICGEIFIKSYFIDKKRWEKRQFCSLSCSSKIKNLGRIPWNKNKKLPHLSGKNSGVYKGENAKYAAIHKWIGYYYKKNNKCDLCKKSNIKTTWANISGNYLRDKIDWLELCYKCHRNYDFNREYKNKYEKETKRIYRK